MIAPLPIIIYLYAYCSNWQLTKYYSLCHFCLRKYWGLYNSLLGYLSACLISSLNWSISVRIKVNYFLLNNIWRKEGNILFNNALNTFYLRLYGIRHAVEDHSESKRWNPLPIAARVLLYAPSHKQDSTYHDLCYTTSHSPLNSHFWREQNVRNGFRLFPLEQRLRPYWNVWSHLIWAWFQTLVWVYPKTYLWWMLNCVEYYMYLQ